MMADKGVFLAYVFVVVAITMIVVFTIVLGNRIRRQYKLLDNIKNEIVEAESQHNVVFSLYDAAKRDLDKTVEVNKAALAKLDEITVKLENTEEALLSKNRELRRAHQEANEYGIYATAACALLNGADIAVAKFPVREVPFLAVDVDSLALRHPVGYELKRKNLMTVGDLVKIEPDSLSHIRGLGPITIDSIVKNLEENGCHFGMEYIRINNRYFTKD